MKNPINLVLIVLTTVLFYSCASVHIYSNNDLRGKTGLKFYPVKPYLLVEFKTSNDMTVKTSILYLPDLANPQYLNVKPGIGSSELKLAFTNGILSSYGLTSDASVSQTINSLASLIDKSSEAIKQFTIKEAGGKDAGGEEIFILYEIVITEEGTKLERVSGEQ